MILVIKYLAKFQITLNFSVLSYFLLHFLSSISLPACVSAVPLFALPFLQLSVVFTYTVCSVC